MSHDLQLCLILLWGVFIGYLLGRYEDKISEWVVGELDTYLDKKEK